MTTAKRSTYVGEFTWRHALYRLRDADGALLYVGITSNLDKRFSEHRSIQRWWPDVADADVAFYPDRPSLEAAEREAINTESPRHNIMGLVSAPRIVAAPSDDQERGGRKLCAIRMSPELIAMVQRVADREGVKWSEAARLLIAYGDRQEMPEGWRPEQVSRREG